MIIEIKKTDECTFLIKLIGTDKTFNDISFIDLPPEISILQLNNIEFECWLSSSESKVEEENLIIKLHINLKLQNIKFEYSQNILFDFGYFQKLSLKEYLIFYIRKEPWQPKAYCLFRKFYDHHHFRIYFNVGPEGKRIFEKPRIAKFKNMKDSFEIFFAEPKCSLEIEYLILLRHTIRNICESKLKFKCEIFDY
uniref:Uncharacterized protein n=1 Tax=Panagrolaimus sp. PS1159 TaxID=55785 RepID=A0AC35F1D7_9BILA